MNILRERYQFHNRQQKTHESVENFVVAVKQLASTCRFGTLEKSLVRDHVIFGLKSKKVLEELINKGGDPTLNDIVSYCSLNDYGGKENIYITDPRIIPDLPSEWGTSPKSEGSMNSDFEQSGNGTINNDEHSCGSTCHSHPNSSMPNETINTSTIRSDRLMPLRIFIQEQGIDSIIESVNKAAEAESKNGTSDCLEGPMHDKSSLASQKHTKNQRSEKKENISCEYCNYKTRNIKLLRRHNKIHHESPSEECTQCSARFRAPSELQKHIFIEHTTDHSANTCPYCGKVYALKTSQLQHIKRLHPEAMPDYVAGRQYECYVCRRPSRSVAELRMHILTHYREKKYLCPQCGFATSKRVQYMVHLMRKDHNLEDKPFKCDVCDKAFSEKAQLQRHMPVHTGERSFQCTICDKRFQTHSNLRIHMYTHGERKYSCSFCDKKFRSPVILKAHIKRHPNQVEDDPILKPFQCNQCGKRLKSSKRLSEHRRLHGLPKHHCLYCDKKMHNKTNLAKHMEMHKRKNHRMRAEQ